MENLILAIYLFLCAVNIWVGLHCKNRISYFNYAVAVFCFGIFLILRFFGDHF